MAHAHDSKDSKKAYGFGTTAIHAGQAPDATTGAVTIPISLATTFAQASPGVHKVCGMSPLAFLLSSY
jgi:cystathionine beta-lyase/cystathionine gamma-synthase